MTAQANELRRGSRKGRYSTGGAPIGRLVRLVMGLALLGLALPPFFTFPWLGFWLVPLAATYLFLLLVLPRLWLFVLPLATVGLDITPLTGRFAYTELDLFFIVTIAAGLLYDRYRLKVFFPRPASIVLLLYLAVVALGFSGWEYFFIPPQAESDNPYYSSTYAYKVLKGLVWGIGLVPMWGYLLAIDKQRSVNALVAGMSAAALLLGLIVLWERGSLGLVVSGAPWYQVVSSILDTTSSYRVTGILSDMHTGGEAFDGVLLMLLPATLYGAIYGRAAWLRILAAVAMMTLAYLTLIGFTRATYAAFAFCMLLYATLTILSRKQHSLSLPFSLPALLAALTAGLVAAAIVYRFAGGYGLACYGALALLAFGAGQWRPPPWALHLVRALALVLIALAVSLHVDSRWVETSWLAALLIVVTLGASFFLVHRLFGGHGALSGLNRVLVLAAIVALPVTLAFALGGYQIGDRASRISADMTARGSHWRHVVESAGSGPLRFLIGNGVGHFPSNYIATHPQMLQAVGSFSIVEQDNRDVLRMGGGSDLTLGQRVAIAEYTNYSVTVHLRAIEAAYLVIGLCERNLIYASSFTPNCVHRRLNFPATDGEFRAVGLSINSGRVGGRPAMQRWPTVLTVQYLHPDSVLGIDAIEFSTDGLNTLQNSSFKRGLDYWFFYNDFSHLPWHIKNTYLQVWFESGWLGLGLFLALLVLLVRTNRDRHAYDSLVPVYTTAALAICVFGLFGSPLDSARVSWMFYFFLAAGLASLQVRSKSHARPTRSG